MARGGQAGLTLVEVVLVVGIMALLSVTVLMTLTPPATEAEKAARAFAARVPALSDRAVTTGRTLGFSAEAGETTHAHGQDGWEATETADWPETISVQLTPGDEILPADPPVEGTLLIYRPPGEEAPPPPPAPPVLFSPTGDATPFTLDFEEDGETWRVTVDALGETEVSRAE